jgi:hypothetical protein
MAEKRSLRKPPPQTIRGVIIYHDDPVLDQRIRRVRMLREEYGYDIAEICQGVEVGRAQVFAYLRQIQEARLMYIAAFPDEFTAGADALVEAISQRRALDEVLRKQLGALEAADNTSPSNKIGILKLVMRNMRELEELRGLLVSRVEHGGEIAVKDSVKAILDQVPEQVRDDYLDALQAVLHAAGQSPLPEHQGSC